MEITNNRRRLATGAGLYVLGSLTVATGLAESLGDHHRAFISLIGFVVAGFGLRFAVDGQ